MANTEDGSPICAKERSGNILGMCRGTAKLGKETRKRNPATNDAQEKDKEGDQKEGGQMIWRSGQ